MAAAAVARPSIYAYTSASKAASKPPSASAAAGVRVSPSPSPQASSAKEGDSGLVDQLRMLPFLIQQRSGRKQREAADVYEYIAATAGFSLRSSPATH